MLDIAPGFEQMAGRFNPIVLIVPGLVSVSAGLFTWLGGLGLRKTLAVVIGGVSGGICGFFIIGLKPSLVLVSAAIAVLLAIIFERIFITILAAVLTAVLSFVVLAGSYLSKIITGGFAYEAGSQTGALGVGQSIEVLKSYLLDYGNDVKQIFSRMPTYNWVIIAVLIVIFIAVGLYSRRFISALCCSALGAILIFTGMVLLLLQKGSEPISYIYSRGWFYAGVFVVMTAFGTAEQLLLCRYRRPGKKTVKKKQVDKVDKSDKCEQEPERQVAQWRTA